MKNKIWYVIGLMSGTSLDGVDLVYVKITRKNEYNFVILQKISINYSDKWKNKLKEAFGYSDDQLNNLDVEYGHFLGGLIHKFIDQNKIKNIDFIASHGHTIFHKPDEGFTLQIGSGAEIANVCNLKVICDFRIQDVLLGGQGAPLVPIGDLLFFKDFDFCLNIGGFANISFQINKDRMAFDICAVNIVLNHFTRKIGLEYDDQGKIASTGTINNELLEELNNHSFFLSEEPKSLGYEFVVETILPAIDRYDLELKDVLNTFIEHAASQISSVINKNIATYSKTKPKVLLTGGGAYNNYLVDRLRKLSEAEIFLPEKKIIEFKEALVFALLGVLKEEEEVNCLKSVTGARKNHSSGKIFYPDQL